MPFIVFEGTDGVGKTTVAKKMAEYMGGVYYPTPPKEWMRAREQVDLHASPEEHYRFYLAGTREASKEICRMIAEGKSVIADRYWVTTYVYHQVEGVAVDRHDFSGIMLPDLTVHLTVSPAEQARRLAERGLSACDKRQLDMQEAVAQGFCRVLAEERGMLLTIDTDRLTVAEVLERVIHGVNALK